MSAPGRSQALKPEPAKGEGTASSHPVGDAQGNRHVPWWHSFRAVAWSFFGIRRGAGHAHDMQHLNPVHVIVAGLVSAAVFVAVLVLVVRWVVGSGVAT